MTHRNEKPLLGKALPVTAPIPLAKDPILHAVKTWILLASMWKTATIEEERTPVDRAAGQQWARLARRPYSDFQVVMHKPRVGDCYDFLCPWTRQYGQCWLKKDGSGEWHQAPTGKAPVLFVLKHEPKPKRQR